MTYRIIIEIPERNERKIRYEYENIRGSLQHLERFRIQLFKLQDIKLTHNIFEKARFIAGYSQ